MDEKIIRKVYGTKSNQKLVVVPARSNILPGDYVLISKIEIV